MSTKPSQIRTIDPFAEYNSNVANRITRMLSGNENVLMSVNSLALTQDTTSPLNVAVVQTGTVFKDDVFIEVTADHQVDFTDLNNYITPGAGFDEIGYYYIVLEYTYVKSRPAPDVDIKILKPSQRGGYPVDSLLMIGVVKVVNVGITQGIDLSDPFHNFDPDPGYEDNKRLYVKSYVGTETGLPVFEQFRDQSRMAYDSETDKFWLGYENQWNEFGVGGSIISIDTTGTNVGEICYTGLSGEAIPAIATALDTGGDVCIKAVGLEVDSSGKALTSGIGIDVPIETANVVTAGDLLYLSSQEAGKVTNTKVTSDTNPYFQVIGRALTSGDSANPIDIIFTPKAVMLESLRGQFTIPDWTLLSGSYYADIDISKLEVTAEYSVLVNLWDNSTSMKIQAQDVEFESSGDTLRIWQPAPQVINWIVTASGSGAGGGGGGGGGGSTDHSLLINLDYASANHTGFAPSPHDNIHHSATYIESSGVRYSALLANGDIGPAVEPFAASHVAPSLHSHAGTIPSGAVMLFGQASAPVGWTQKVTGFSDDAMIVVSTTLGGGAGQGGSADARSYNPLISAIAVGNHTHSTGSHTLTTAEMPAHTHAPQAGYATFMSSSGNTHGSGGDSYGTFGNTASAGGGLAHNHGATGSGGAHNHTMNYSNYAPYYFTIIAATKD